MPSRNSRNERGPGDRLADERARPGHPRASAQAVRRSAGHTGRGGARIGSRPVDRVAYAGDSTEVDLPELAAAYAFGIARNHPFIDGNKRAALLALVTFLGLNDIDFLADEAEAVVMIRGLAAGEIDESGLTRWIRDNAPA